MSSQVGGVTMWAGSLALQTPHWATHNKPSLPLCEGWDLPMLLKPPLFGFFV